MHKYLVCFLLFLIPQEKDHLFDRVIDENKGKVVFVDIWASWCAPCRKEMKNTKKLKEKYKDLNFEVVYLSIDGLENDWKKASIKEGIENEKYNLFGFGIRLKNQDKLKTIKITEIPRYLIFNKKGELVNDNAPSPNKKELHNLIEQYLKE